MINQLEVEMEEVNGRRAKSNQKTTSGTKNFEGPLSQERQSRQR